MFNINKIKHVEAITPGHDEWKSVGSVSLMTQSEILNKNVTAKAHAHAASGLYFSLDDISMPKVFVQMDFSDAEKWLLIIEKLINGSLEKQPSPMPYPQAI